ncbi:hypothetical protein A2U01_0100216, partial [Trifolium medium]|nr:hypothetical protein [Trifolium medium]
GQTDNFQVPGEEQRASSLSEPLPRSAIIHALAQRGYPSLSDASPKLGLSLDNWPWSRPNLIFTTFDP